MRPYDVGLLCGRFQTIHKGHESLVETGINLCDRLLILVGSAQECGTERNPFNISTRMKMIKTIYGDKPNIMIYGLADMTNRSDWFSPEDIRETSELIVNRGKIPLSATMVREYMVKDDRKAWMRCVNPRLHKLYDELRSELMSVPYYQTMAKEDNNELHNNK